MNRLQLIQRQAKSVGQPEGAGALRQADKLLTRHPIWKLFQSSGAAGLSLFWPGRGWAEFSVVASLCFYVACGLKDVLWCLL